MSAVCRWPWLLLLAPLFASGAGSVVITDEVRAELVAHAPEGVAPGKPLWLGLSIQHAPHWHTYWKNPGDSGLPTTLAWQLPAGVSAGAIAWPTPQRLRIGPLANYGYEGRVLLPVAVNVGAGFGAPALPVKLHAEWLVCRESCIPQSGDFVLTLPAGATTTEHAQLFAAAEAAQPRSLQQVAANATLSAQALQLDIDGLPAGLHGKPVDFFAEDAGVIDHAAPLEQRWDESRLVLRVPLSAQRSESPATMQAVLATPGEPAGVALRFAVAGWPAGAGASVAAAQPVAALPSLGVLAAMAFVGGLLLNLMPCVFPVLSLKLLGFAQHGADRKQLAAGGIAYTAGVLLSFVALAGLLLAFRAGGQQLGWGFQLQSPVFIALLALLFVLIGLNLLGVFEVATLLPNRWATLRARHPVADHALTGVLAVAIASPCTAPFMGAALGAALTLPPLPALLVFAFLGLGMAAPYLGASLWPGLARRLPRPGPWMARFKLAMAVPMFATVAWLLWVLAQQLGSDTTITASRWERWTPEATSRALADGRPVFVDFTAAWCVTCQVNERMTLADEGLLKEFDARRMLLLRADWTQRDAAITQELQRLGRNGVPVYALYAPGGGEPQLMSEILSAGEIREAMARWPASRAALQPRLP